MAGDAAFASNESSVHEVVSSLTDSAASLPETKIFAIRKLCVGRYTKFLIFNQISNSIHSNPIKLRLHN